MKTFDRINSASERLAMMSSNQTTPRMDESDIYDMVDDKEFFSDEEYRFII